MGFPEKRRLALVGAGGMLGRMIQALAPKDFAVYPLGHRRLDLTDHSSVAAAMEEVVPDVIINCAAYTNVDGAESDERTAFQVNGEGPALLASAARKYSATLVHISTDFVFDGKNSSPYLEEDKPGPLSVYGCSKLQGEIEVIKSGLEKYFIIRTSWLFGPGGKNFVETISRLAREREELRIVADQRGTPTYTEDLAGAIFNLLALEKRTHQGGCPYGLYHFSNQGACSWYEFACEIVSLLKKNGRPLKVKRIVPIATEDFPLPARRPAYSVLCKQKYISATGGDIPFWTESLRKYFLIQKNAGTCQTQG